MLASQALIIAILSLAPTTLANKIDKYVPQIWAYDGVGGKLYPYLHERICACGKRVVYKGMTHTYRCCFESGGRFHEGAGPYGGTCTSLVKNETLGTVDGNIEKDIEPEFFSCCGRLGTGPGTQTVNTCGTIGSHDGYW